MTLTPHRDAAVSSVEQAKQRFDALQPCDPVALIGDTMSIEACSAILIGAADMMDLEAPLSRVGSSVNWALSNALASFILTITNGDQALARQYLPAAITALHATTLERLGFADRDATIGRARGAQPRGTA